MKEDRRGREVYNIKNGVRGEVLSDSGDYLVIRSGELSFGVTNLVFSKNYRIVPQEGGKEEPEIEEMPMEEESSGPLPAGEPGIGKVLSDLFVEMCKLRAKDPIDFTYKDEKRKKFTVKYNGYNVFECVETSRRFNVFCNPKALTYRNKRLADKIYPKSFKWSLSAKFIFTSDQDRNRMKSIIIDSLYYRREAKD